MSSLYELTGQFKELAVLMDGADEDLAIAVRDTLGAIEADRDRRHARSAQTTVRYRTAPSAPAIPLRPELVAR